MSPEQSSAGLRTSNLFDCIMIPQHYSAGLP